MKCFFHEDADAVATCQVCGKSLCKECASKHTPCMCDECFTTQVLSKEEEKKNKKKEALIDTNKELLFACLKGLICTLVLTWIFAAMGSSPVSTGMSVMFFFVPFGWAVITYLEQWLPVFLMSGPIFLIYIVLKLFFSMVLGIPCFLYQIVKYVVKILHARTTE